MKMKRRGIFGLIILGVLAALVVGTLLYVTQDKTRTEDIRREQKACEAGRVVSAVISLVEHPSAGRVILLGERAADYREPFAHAGLEVAEGRMSPKSGDIVFFAGDRDARPFGRKTVEGVLYVRCVDARDLLASSFRQILEGHPGDARHLWMPGANDWILTGRLGKSPLKLGDMMDAFAREGLFEDLARAECDSITDLLANYVGTVEEVLPAFNGTDARVRADNFVMREVPPFDWFDASDVESDIRDMVLADIRTAQIVRRVVLEGNLAADEGKENEAIAAWARAALRNPQDTMLVERISHLRVNAQTFERVANFSMAARCYETIGRIFPNDPAPILRFAKCMESLGRKDLAKTAQARAKQLLSARRTHK